MQLGTLLPLGDIGGDPATVREYAQAAEAIGTFRRGGQLGDAKRRGVGEEDRPLRHDAFQRGVGRALLVEVLDDRLDHEITVRERVE